MSTRRSIKGQAAVVGLGQSTYYKHGGSPDPEIVLAFKAILAAAADAGIDAKEIDGFVSYSDDRNNSQRIANGLGVTEMRWSTMQWGGGGAGGAGAVQQAAAAVAAGFADTVVVYRGIAQGQFGRFGAGVGRIPLDSLRSAYGVNTPAEFYASRMTRFMHEHGIGYEAQRAVSMASYHHAQNNPAALMNGRPLTEEKYDTSRWIVEPWRLYDCCQENDGAAALIVTSPERARDLTDRPAYVLAAAMGEGHRGGAFYEGIYDPTNFATAEYASLAPRLFEMAELTPADVDVVQSYENFTGGVVMSLIEHGFCEPEQANEFMTLENFVSTGSFPLNTSGGNLAEAYIHGFELHLEAVRQLRGDSPNQVADARVSLVSAGPMVTPASTIVYGTEETLA